MMIESRFKSVQKNIENKLNSLNKKSSQRKIIGLSALPGTGKTTLGKWLESISLKLKIKLPHDS